MNSSTVTFPGTTHPTSNVSKKEEKTCWGVLEPEMTSGCTDESYIDAIFVASNNPEPS